MDKLIITISISSDQSMWLNVENQERLTIIDEEMDARKVITGDYIDIIHPISRILRIIRDKKGYTFISKQLEIELNLSLDGENKVIRHI
jgi:hypothetical protein